MRIQKYYYYLFYKFYKFWEYISVPKVWSDWKACISIDALEIWLLFSCLNGYSLINNIKLDLSFKHPAVLFPFLLILILNGMVFIYHDSIWKEYFKEFEAMPKWKNRTGSIIICIIVAAIVTAYFMSAYYLQRNVLKI